MRQLSALVVAGAVVLAGGVAPFAQPGRSAAADVQLQLGDLLFAEGRYAEAGDAYRRATHASDDALARRAGAGLVLSLLRTADFQGALQVASALGQTHSSDPDIVAMRGDALWSTGQFEEAEAAYEAALSREATQPRARHGLARALAARNRLDDALTNALDAVALTPREAEFHHTLAAVYERLRRFDDAAASLASYIDRLPNKERSEKAGWARAEIRFLQSFKGRAPLHVDALPAAGTFTVPIKIRGDKVTVAGKINGGPQEFVLDTGAERTVISQEVARRRGVMPITAMQTAGVGEHGLRGLEVGRIDTLEIGELRMRNVPCLIKNPPLGGLPAREPESLSPLALGFSMRVDYQRRTLTIGRSLAPAAYSDEMPLRMHRLALVRGTVNGSLPATFVVDTGGELISISDATAGQIQPATPGRRIPLRVYGTSGWDKDAFLMPNVDLAFSSIRFTGIPVVVLNLRAPSALLGFQLGGIVGHRFLSRYRVTIDMERSMVGLEGS
ncbi:MAG TPA: aspartyl protease family protein [Vicinamibacterales bacterium]|nr:aspartyl protease family protein [Vicinamibacterales bacterium]